MCYLVSPDWLGSKIYFKQEWKLEMLQALWIQVKYFSTPISHYLSRGLSIKTKINLNLFKYPVRTAQ